jgi:RNA recognition motif-containing protein
MQQALKWSTTSVFVRGLPETTTLDHITQAFAQFGKVQPSSKVVADKGFAFVDFPSPDGANKALAAGTVSVNDTQARVEKRAVQNPTAYVTPVAPGTTEATLRDVFASLVAPPLSVRFGARPNQDGEVYAFIEFGKDSELEAALAQSGMEVGGVALKVERVRKTIRIRRVQGRVQLEAQPQQQQQQQQQRGGGGGGAGPRRAAGNNNNNNFAANGGGGAGQQQPGDGGARPPRRPRNNNRGDAPPPAAAAAAAAAPREPRAPRQEKPAIYIKSLPDGTTEDELRASFGTYGQVSRVDVRNLDQIKAFVTFAAAQGCAAASTASQEGKVLDAAGGEPLKVLPTRNEPHVAYVSASFDDTD